MICLHQMEEFLITNILASLRSKIGLVAQSDLNNNVTCGVTLEPQQGHMTIEHVPRG